MDSPLHKAPQGILGAFALKTLGQNPDVFGGTIRPGVDVFDHYLFDELQRRFDNPVVTNPATVSSLGSIIVPQGQVYRILAIGVNGALDAADVALTGLVSVSVNPTQSPGPINIWSADFVKGGVFVQAGLYLPRPLTLPPGWEVNCTVVLSAAPAVSFTASFGLLLQVIPT